MKRLFVISLAVCLLVILATPIALAEGVGIDNPPGVPLYVIIEVDWDGESAYGDWTVWGPKWDPVVGVGDPLTACTGCLEMNYEFTFRGKTVLFDEIMVETVVGTPQEYQVVLFDKDGDGTYTGSLAAAHYFPWAEGDTAITYFDRIDYDITFDGDGNVTYFHYLQYEHKKLP